MVTVPALGAEWGKDELEGMTKRARREEKSDRFKVKWRAFNRGQYGMFGKKWLTRRTIVFTVFALCIAYVFSFLAFAHRTYLGHASPLPRQHRYHSCFCHPARTWLRYQRVNTSHARNRLV